MKREGSARADPAYRFPADMAPALKAGFVVLSVAYATHMYAADHAGLIAGTGAGSWSLMVAIVMRIFGRFFDIRRYDEAFWIATAIPLAGYAGWRWFNLRAPPFR